MTVIDVDRPDRKMRRLRGKSDPIDAYAAATAVASGRATGIPKSRDGVVEAVRVLRVARRSAVKARTQAMNQIRNLLVTAPAMLREQVAGLDRTALIRTLARQTSRGLRTWGFRSPASGVLFRRCRGVRAGVLGL
ncbi:IS110 family transposase, partial [Streptomyces sp. NPDC001275]